MATKTKITVEVALAAAAAMAAAEAAAVTAGFIPVSPDGKDQKVQNFRLHIWESFKTYAVALDKSDDTGGFLADNFVETALEPIPSPTPPVPLT